MCTIQHLLPINIPMVYYLRYINKHFTAPEELDKKEEKAPTDGQMRTALDLLERGLQACD